MLNPGRCPDFGNHEPWYFYTNVEGTLQLADDETISYSIEINRKHPCQVGYYANVKNARYGVSFWFFIKDSSGKTVAHGDLNSNIECPTYLPPTPYPTPYVGAFNLTFRVTNQQQTHHPYCTANPRTHDYNYNYDPIFNTIPNTICKCLQSSYRVIN